MNALCKKNDHLQFAIAPTVRFAQDANGLVLLDVRRGCYLTFNRLGGLVWSRIAAGASTCELIEQIHQEFAGADREIIEQDVRALLAQLFDEGMIIEGRPEAFSSSHEAKPTPAREAAPSTGSSGGLATLTAFLVLIYIDLLMRFTHFCRVYDTVRTTTTRPRQASANEVAKTCRAIHRAARVYVKRAWCLQRSAACVWLLRRLGAQAELVFGVRTFPFAAHAWVELDGQILNDHLEYVGSFLVIDRI